jgi:hypothetical protein
MFMCQVTGRMSKPGEKMNRITVAKRERTYSRKEKNEDTGRWEDVEIGHGWEIVRQIVATDEGVAEWDSMSDAQRKLHLQNI